MMMNTSGTKIETSFTPKIQQLEPVPEPAAAAKAAAASATLRVLPADFVKRHRVLPLKIQDGILHVATAEPGNARVLDDIRLLTGLEVAEVELPAEEIAETIAGRYQVTVEKMIENLGGEHGTNGEGKTLHDIEVMANEPTVVNLVNLIVSTAIRERASDIHFVPFENSLQLRYRIDGLLQEKPPPPKQLHAAIVSRIKIMADMNIAERFMPQDGHIQINHRGARVDIRVGTLPTIYGESLVMRLLEKNSRVQTPFRNSASTRTARRCSRASSANRTGFFSPPARPVAAKPRRCMPSCKAFTRRN